MTVRSAVVSGLGILEESGPSCSAMNGNFASFISQIFPDASKQELDYVFLLNRVLPRDIRVVAWSPVDLDFNAR